MTVDLESCLTCGDVAVVARVLSVDRLEAVVETAAGKERVGIDLVPDVRPGDDLLCHAGIALQRVEAGAAE